MDAEIPALPAATIVLVRDAAGGAGIEVLLLRRTARAAFAAGMYVFPGGRVDPADGADGVEQYCDGLDEVAASAALGIGHGGLAYWVAAVRECFEEAGVLLARLGGELPTVDERRAVHDGELSMVELCRRCDLRLDLSGIYYIAHWVTPIGETSRRFDTRFFLAAAPTDGIAAHDETETVDSRWVGPSAALAEQAARTITLMPPTKATLRFLAEHDSLASVLAAAAAIVPSRIQPRVRRDGDGRIVGVAMPGDADYEALT